MIPVRYGQETKTAFRAHFFEISPCLIDGDFVANKLRAISQPAKSLARAAPVASGVIPFPNAVIVRVAKESAPERSDLIVVQADKVARNRPSRKTDKENGIRISAIFAACSSDNRLAVFDSRLDVTPPLELIVLLILADIRRSYPDKPLTAADAVPKVTILDFSAANIAELISIRPVTCVLDNNRIELSFPPVSWKKQSVVDFGPLVFLECLPDAFAGSRFFFRHCRRSQIHCHIANISKFLLAHGPTREDH